jgi:alpha-tubulin suppressor-like RCC1 family protein
MKTQAPKFSLALIGLVLAFNIRLPTVLAGPAVTSIACGADHSLFSKADGSLWVMGDNYHGQLGIGPTHANTNLPTQVLSSGVQRVAAGWQHSLCIVSGSLWVMGYNAYGSLGDGTTNDQFFPERIVTASSHLSVDAMAGGSFHSLFATFGGAFVGNYNLSATGANGAGELGDGTFTVHYSPEIIRPRASITAVAAGEGHSLFLQSDGSLWGMGDNRYGALGLGSIAETNIQVEIWSGGVTAVAAGPYHSLFIRSDGSLWAMGDNTFGQLGDNSTNNSYMPEQIVSGGVTAVAGGNDHSLFIKSDGSLWAMGGNFYGELGDGTTTQRLAPVMILSSNVVAVAAGDLHSLFIKSDGSLWGMGYSLSGQLGTGDYAEHHAPVLIVAGPPPAPVITGIHLSGANLILTGANGVSGETIHTLTSTNVAQPLSQWQPVATNVLSMDGNFTITAANAVISGAPQQFYILQAQ